MPLLLADGTGKVFFIFHKNPYAKDGLLGVETGMRLSKDR